MYHHFLFILIWKREGFNTNKDISLYSDTYLPAFQGPAPTVLVAVCNFKCTGILITRVKVQALQLQIFTEATELLNSSVLNHTEVSIYSLYATFASILLAKNLLGQSSKNVDLRRTGYQMPVWRLVLKARLDGAISNLLFYYLRGAKAKSVRKII